MDGNGRMNIRNWGFYEPTNVLKGHLGLHLMPTAAEKPNLGEQHHPPVMATANAGSFYYRGCGVSDSPIPMDYMRDAWITHRDRYLNVLPENHHPTFAVLPETSGGHTVQIIHPPDSLKDERVDQIEETDAEMDLGDHLKKRPANKTQKSPKPKKVKRAPRDPRDESSPSVQRARAPKKSAEVIINGIDMDISGIRIPVCSCTGTPQQCYRWGSGGWQSACCTTGMSMYPLPMSTKRRGTRIAGRKMSLGAFKKVLEKLASEGYNFSNPIDLRTHWAKHGTNKFVTIK